MKGRQMEMAAVWGVDCAAGMATREEGRGKAFAIEPGYWQGQRIKALVDVKKLVWFEKGITRRFEAPIPGILGLVEFEVVHNIERLMAVHDGPRTGLIRGQTHPVLVSSQVQDTWPRDRSLVIEACPILAKLGVTETKLKEMEEELRLQGGRDMETSCEWLIQLKTSSTKQSHRSMMLPWPSSHKRAEPAQNNISSGCTARHLSIDHPAGYE